MDMFSTTPIEAGIWQSFVGIQASIAKGLQDVNITKAAFIMSLSVILFLFLVDLASRKMIFSTVKKFSKQLFIISIGLVFCTKISDKSFNVIDLNGNSWGSMPGVSKSHDQNVQALSAGSANALFGYVYIQGAINELSKYATILAITATGGDDYKSSPFFAYKALMSATTATLDDPNIATKIEQLVNNCSDTQKGAIVNSTSGFKDFLNMSDSNCSALYNSLQGDLTNWAEKKSNWSDKFKSFWNANLLNGTEGYKNALIANAFSKYAKMRMGEVGAFRTHNQMLLENARDGNDSNEYGMGFAPGDHASGWVNMEKALSLPGFAQTLNHVTGGFFSQDNYVGEDQANEVAAIYDKMLSILPAVMGYCHGVLAIIFLFSSFAMVFANTKFMKSWLISAGLMALYNPLSAAMYNITSKFLFTASVNDSFSALKADPLSVGAAEIINSHVSMIEIAYFGCQMGLILIFAAGGLTSFVKSAMQSYAGGISTASSTISSIIHNGRNIAGVIKR